MNYMGLLFTNYNDNNKYKIPSLSKPRWNILWKRKNYYFYVNLSLRIVLIECRDSIDSN